MFWLKQNFIYTCLSVKIINKFESSNIKFHKSFYIETVNWGGGSNTRQDLKVIPWTIFL